MTETTVEHLAPLIEAVDELGARWLEALGGARSSAVVDDDVDAMTDAALMALNEVLSAVGRRYQVLHARIANGIGKRSAPERGTEGLARKAGYKSPAKLIAASTGGHSADAQRLIQVGDATAGRMTFTGERAPAKHPHVGAALESDALSVTAANAITSLLDKLACRVDRSRLDAAEKTVTEQAAGLSLSELQVILRRAEAWLDPDGLEPKIDDLRAKRYLKIWEDPHGMIAIDGKLDPATGAPIKAAIEGLVSAQIRALRGHNQPDQNTTASGWVWGGESAADAMGAGSPGSAATAGARADAAAEADAGAQADDLSGLVERRTISQLNADALAALCKHALGCDQTALPLAATTVIVRIPLEALTTGTGVATIDGISQPVDAGTARRIAADAEVIPVVLGADSEVLDFGRKRRLFSRAQRLSLWERDGGCVGCGAPPGMCEVHHLTWWSRGGTTDLGNGVLLCTSCHHRIHAHGWDIRIEGSEVWLIPPAHVDASRTPRHGGRRRYDYTPAA